MSINYHLKRSKNRKTLAIKIKAKEVFVYAPAYLEIQVIEHWLTQKQNWINTHLAKQQANEQVVSILDKSAVTILGKTTKLKFQGNQRKSTVALVGDMLTVNTSSRVKHQGSKQLTLLTDFIKGYLREYCTERADFFADKLNAAVNNVSVKHLRSRWGSCDSKGRLLFNLQLATAPLEVIDYVVAHEVAHLKVMDHSQQFWQLVGTIYPDYKSAENWLKENGYKLDIFKEC